MLQQVLPFSRMYTKTQVVTVHEHTSKRLHRQWITTHIVTHTHIHTSSMTQAASLHTTDTLFSIAEKL